MFGKMNDFNFITNFIQGAKTAKLNLKKPIGSGINGADFADEMDFLANMGVESVVIEINSIGGSIKEGFSIFSAIKDSPMKTTTRVVGISASMAGIISQAGDHRTIVDYGIFHAHGPQVPAGKKVEKGLLNIMLDSLKTLISSRTDLTAEQIDEIMSKETVLTASEAYEMGFFDEIETTRVVKPALATTENVEALFEMANEFLTKNEQMKGLKTILEIENGTEAEIEAKVSELKAEAGKVEALENKVTELTAEAEKVEALENKVTELETEKSSLIETSATELVENAIQAGKISADSKETWLTQAKNDLEGTKVLLSGVSTVAKASKVVENIKPEAGAEDVENSKSWDFQQWGENNPEGLEKMKNEDPEKFNELLNSYLVN